MSERPTRNLQSQNTSIPRLTRAQSRRAVRSETPVYPHPDSEAPAEMSSRVQDANNGDPQAHISHTGQDAQAEKAFLQEVLQPEADNGTESSRPKLLRESPFPTSLNPRDHEGVEFRTLLGHYVLFLNKTAGMASLVLDHEHFAKQYRDFPVEYGPQWNQYMQWVKQLQKHPNFEREIRWYPRYSHLANVKEVVLDPDYLNRRAGERLMRDLDGRAGGSVVLRLLREERLREVSRDAFQGPRQ